MEPKSIELPAPSHIKENPLLHTKLPKLDLSRNAGDHYDFTDLVTLDQCMVHLKLLAVLADLRDTISSHDGLFGIYDSAASQYSPQYQYDLALARIRDKRWALFTARAVDRYEKWWSFALPSSRNRLTVADMVAPSFRDIVDTESTLKWKNPPPIDVLMVLHSHMLNPRDFLEDCLIHGKMSLWNTGFPFELVNNCIDDESLEYTVSQNSQAHFTEKVNLKWDNILDSMVKDIVCPGCQETIHVAWTSNKTEEGNDPSELFKQRTGYADSSFKAVCLHCKFEIDHGRLRVYKFRKDITDYFEHDYPIPGSILNTKGMPENFDQKESKSSSKNFMNQLVSQIGKRLDVYTKHTEPCDMSDISSDIKAKIRTYDDRKQFFGFKFSKDPLQGANKIFFQRMMKHYSDNFSLFGLDLVGAVIRQAAFVQKMDIIDWLHSPTVMQTTQRLISKYTVFMNIMISNSAKMAVPTLDIDLAWHTHQLIPQHYFKHTTSKTGFFINHDDKIEEVQLLKAFEWTSKMYRRTTNGEVYSACTCWYCEAVLVPDIHEKILKDIGSTPCAVRNADALHEAVSDPETEPYISVHNTMRPTLRTTTDDARSIFHQLYLQASHAKALRRSKKRQHSSPETDAEGVNFSNSWTGPDYATPLV